MKCSYCNKIRESIGKYQDKYACRDCIAFFRFRDSYVPPLFISKILFLIKKFKDIFVKEQKLERSVSFDPQITFGVVPTVYYKWYGKNGGNVSVNRIKMVKSRKLCPDGKGEVVMKNYAEKITDRLAYNY